MQGLALFALIGVGIRVLLTMTIQPRRERANRQVNQRLKTLMSQEAQVRLAAKAVVEMVEGRPIYTAELVVALRDFIRKPLDLDPIPADVKMPLQGPTRPQASGRCGRGSRGDSGREARREDGHRKVGKVAVVGAVVGAVPRLPAVELDWGSGWGGLRKTTTGKMWGIRLVHDNQLPGTFAIGAAGTGSKGRCLPLLQLDRWFEREARPRCRCGRRA